ncbi:MAG: hypothetical protein WCG07_00010 [Candidatus Taylorbacteria bacterium]
MASKLKVTVGDNGEQVPIVGSDECKKVAEAIQHGYHFATRQELVLFRQGKFQLPPHIIEKINASRQASTSRLHVQPRDPRDQIFLDRRVMV